MTLSAKKLTAAFFLAFFAFYGSYNLYAEEACSNPGETQYKIKEPCDDSVRTCCPYYEYSPWDGACKEACPSSCERGYVRTSSGWGDFSECCNCPDPKYIGDGLDSSGRPVKLCKCPNPTEQNGCINNSGTWNSDNCTCTCPDSLRFKAQYCETAQVGTVRRGGTWNSNSCSCECPADSYLGDDGYCHCNNGQWTGSSCSCSLTCGGSGTLNKELCKCECPTGYQYVNTTGQFYEYHCTGNTYVTSGYSNISNDCVKNCGNYYVQYPRTCDNPVNNCIASGGVPVCLSGSYSSCKSK